MSDNLGSVSRSFDLQMHIIYSKQLGHRRCGWMSPWLQLKRKLAPSNRIGRVRRKVGTPVGTQMSACIRRTSAIRWGFAWLLTSFLEWLAYWLIRYLLLQWRLSESDSVDGLYATFTNVYEKGYCAEKVVLRTGQQLIIQSERVKNDNKFKRKKTKLSASVGSDRSGNEGE